MSSPPLSQPGDRAGLLVQAAGSLKSGLASAPGPGPGPASSSERGASSGRPGYPVAARGGPRRVNWRWSRPQRPAHGVRTPGRPVRATLRHAITSGPTTLRALDGVPSGVPLCADHLEPHPITPGGSIFTINTGSVYQIGPSRGSDIDRSLRSNMIIHPQFADQITFVLRLNTVQVKSIPDQIKDRVLEWACGLEAAGVTGDGMSFSEKEKQIAHSVTFNIHNSNIGQLNNQGTNLRLDNGEF
jgi:hypothetical protein